MAKSMMRKPETSKETTVETTVLKQTEQVAEQVEYKKKEKKVFEQSEGVMCHSVTQGGLFVEGPKTGMIYRFTDYGDEYEIEYRDLVSLVRSKSSYVYHPYFVIDDEDFIAEFPQITKFYTEQYTVKDLKSILNEDIYTMEAKIQSLPVGAVESLKTIASTMITKGQIDSISKVRKLNELFGTELEISDNLANL